MLIDESHAARILTLDFIIREMQPIREYCEEMSDKTDTVGWFSMFKAAVTIETEARHLQSWLKVYGEK